VDGQESGGEANRRFLAARACICAGDRVRRSRLRRYLHVHGVASLACERWWRLAWLDQVAAGLPLAGDGGCRLNVAAMSVAGSWWRLAWPDPAAAGLDPCPSPLSADGDRACGCRGGEGAVVLRAWAAWAARRLAASPSVRRRHGHSGQQGRGHAGGGAARCSVAAKLSWFRCQLQR